MNTNLFAPILIANYVWYEISRIDPAFTSTYSGIVPFFPLYDNQGGNAKWGNRPYVVYDLMSVRRKSPLYVVKKQSMLMSIRGVVPELLYFRDLIDYVLDRSDDAGKDLNEWAGANVVNHQVFFHSFSTYEENWSSEITVPKDTRQAVSKDLIVEYDFHFARYLNDGQGSYSPGLPAPDSGIQLLPQPSFNWTQATPATSWIINHNLGFKPVIQVLDTAGNQMEALAVHTSLNQIVVYFITPTAGSARLV